MTARRLTNLGLDVLTWLVLFAMLAPFLWLIASSLQTDGQLSSGAYDLLHNGKVTIYASYGKFFDIMKMALARGSFGSHYWHNCVYALDDTNYSAITPTYPIGGVVRLARISHQSIEISEIR